MSASALVLAVAWMAGVFTVGFPRRRAARIHDLRAAPAPPGHGLPGSARPSAPVWSALLTRVGGAVRRITRRPADEAADRRLGRALPVLVLVPLGVPLPLAVAVVVGVWCRPVLTARRARRRRDRALVDELPDAVDLLRLAIQSGGNARLAVHAVAARLDGEVGDHLRRVCGRVELGDRLADALATLRSVEPLRPVADALIDAERYGVALGPSLDRLAAEARSQRRRQAEERARRVPVAMLFPLVGCILPSFALLTVVPLFAGTLRTLHL